MKRNELTVKDLDPSDVQSALDNLRLTERNPQRRYLKTLKKPCCLRLSLYQNLESGH